MNTLDRAEAYRVFSQALDLPVAEQAAFVTERCRDSPAVQRVVEKLLTIAARDAGATGILSGAVAPQSAPLLGREFGPFRLQELLGSGGMGTVYRAERTDGIPQTVAIKILRQGVSAADSSQFVREARILARLEHPSIARLIDAGVEDGTGWIAMEFVAGRPVTAYCEQLALGVAARVQLLLAVAEAVATAHRALIVHRDIKPSNVLVSDDGVPRLIDFGIAYALGRPNETREATADVSRLFTPHYAAPEQVRGDPVTVATDVFGLGALAYRVLSGQEPFAAAESPVAYLLRVTQHDVEPPSEMARTAANPGLARALQGDLDCILMKALAREPHERYAGIAELQADLRAYLEGRPVRAHAPSLSYRAGKFVRRHAVGLGVAAVLAAALVTAGIVYRAQEHRVASAQAAAAQRGQFLERLLKSANPREGRRDITVAELLDSAAHELQNDFHGEPLVEASMLGLIVDTNAGLGRYAEGVAASDRQLQLLRAHGGSDLELARALGSRGQLLRGHGQFPESIAALRQALALLGPLRNVDEDREAVLHELGGALGRSGSEREGEALLRQAMALAAQLEVSQRGVLGVVQNDLAVLLGNEGRYAESAEMARQAVATARRFLAENHPYVLATEQTYAMALLNLHRPQEAELIQREIITRSAAVNGPQARDTLIARVQLGETLSDLGRYRDAEALLQPAAADLERVEGTENIYATGAWSDYAIAACSGGDAAAGLGAAQRILAIRTRALKADDWHILAAQVDVGLCLGRLHRDAEGEPLLLAAAGRLEAARGPGFFTTQLAYRALRDLYQDEGRAADVARMAAKIRN